MPLTLRTSAFADGKPIPRKYTRDGENLSPPLAWTGAPPGTKGFALIMEDPDAPNGTFFHWSVHDIPAGREGLPEGFGSYTGGVEGTKFGVNDFGRAGYDGPEPPVGHGVHRYHFRLAALDVPSLSLSDQVKVPEVWQEAKKHALATVEVVGTYKR